MLCHHVLGHGYRNPALIAKMSATRGASGGRFIRHPAVGERVPLYGYDFPPPPIDCANSRGVVQICRLM
jgi:hypothetical protein